MANNCMNCRFALKFVIPPSVGGLTDGVHCASAFVATEQAEASGYEEDRIEARQVFERDGFVRLWRFEEVAGYDDDCPGWGATDGPLKFTEGDPED